MPLPAAWGDGQSAGNGPWYHVSMSQLEIETPLGGSSSVPASPWARSSSRVTHCAAPSSTPSTSMSVVTALPKNPSIRLAGNGHGWLPP